MGQAGNRHLDAIDAQLQLLDTWSSMDGLTQAEMWLQDQRKLDTRGAVTFGYDTDPSFGPDGATPDMVMAKTIYHALDRASTYWVSADMMAMIERAMVDMPDEPLAPMDMPSQSGFAYLDTPYYVVDVNGLRCNAQAVMWYPSYFHLAIPDTDQIGVARVISVVYFSDAFDEDDEAWGQFETIEARRKFVGGSRRFRLLGHVVWPWRDGETSDAVHLTVRMGKYGAPYDWAPGEYEEYPTDPTVRLHTDWDPWGGKFLVALWRVATQQIMQVSRRHFDRPTLRRIKRSKHSPDWGDVRVIDLRRFVYPLDAGAERERYKGDWEGEREYWYSHRFRVAPQWKRQWYPSEQRHKWIYLESYVKGPEHLPLVEKDDVRRIVR